MELCDNMIQVTWEFFNLKVRRNLYNFYDQMKNLQQARHITYNSAKQPTKSLTFVLIDWNVHHLNDTNIIFCQSKLFKYFSLDAECSLDRRFPIFGPEIHSPHNQVNKFVSLN